MDVGMTENNDETSLKELFQEIKRFRPRLSDYTLLCALLYVWLSYSTELGVLQDETKRMVKMKQYCHQVGQFHECYRLVPYGINIQQDRLTPEYQEQIGPKDDDTDK